MGDTPLASPLLLPRLKILLGNSQLLGDVQGNICLANISFLCNSVACNGEVSAPSSTLQD
jgi:hypothetical protein